MNDKVYNLPNLPYDYSALEPFISEEQLKVHHTKHHQGYVNKANSTLEKIEKARQNKSDLDLKLVLKFLSFAVGGHILHSLFWKNMREAREGNKPEGALAEAVQKEFGSFERFKEEFVKTASTVEGSGWAALVVDEESSKLFLGQVEKHNMVLYPNSKIIMVLDAWEHAYYLDYKNDKKKFFEGFWNIVNWEEVNKRFEKTK